MRRVCHITDHAIDQASVRLWRLWRRERSAKDVGLFEWLKDRTQDAVSRLPEGHRGDRQLSVAGITFLFRADEEALVLVTVWRSTQQKTEVDDG